MKETEKDIWHHDENMRWLREKSSSVSDEFVLAGPGGTGGWIMPAAAAAKSEQDPFAQ